MEAAEQRHVDVLQVHVVDELAVRVQQLERVSATECRVAGIEAEAEQRSIEPLDEPLDLAGRLDVRAGVVVERRGEAAFAALLGRAVRALEEQCESLVVEPGLGVLLDPPGEGQALGLAERVRDQDRRPGIASARLVQQLERLVETLQVGLDVLAARESQREERAHQHEPARPERVGDGRAVAEVARRSELAARVAELCHRLQRAPGPPADHHGRRSARRRRS